MGELSLSNVSAGLLAYLIAAIVGAGPFVHLAFRLDVFLSKGDEERRLNAGHRSTAIELGTTILCQAILARHAVFSIMAVVRSIFVEDLSASTKLGLFFRSALICAALVSLSLLSVWAAGTIFKRLTKRLKEDEQIRNDNLAMAIFFALVLLSITMVLNEGMEDFSRSLIPYGRIGLSQLP